jgi:diacylglycerol kinase family enzyme
MSKICIYSNSHAATAEGMNWSPELSTIFYRQELIFRKTETLDELAEKLKEDISSGCTFFISIGGDGTVNAMIQHLAGYDVKLLCLPGGTANDLSSELRIPHASSQILRMVQAKSYKKIDLIKINEKYMATNGGIGLPVKLIEEINHLRMKSSFFKLIMSKTKAHIYALFLIKNLVLSKLAYNRLHIQCDDLPISENQFNTPLILINNQRFLGGKFNVGEDTRNDDGTFNVKIFTHENFFSFIRDLLLMRLNRFKGSKNVLNFETKKLNLSSLNGEQITFFGDGELLMRDSKIQIQICPNLLSVYFYEKSRLKFKSYDLASIGEIK